MHACSAGCGGKEREGEGEGAKRDSGQISPWQGSLPVLGIFPHRRHSCLAFAAAKRKQDSHARRESHRNSIHRSAAIRFVRTSRSLNPLMQLFSPSLGWTFDLGLLLLHCCLCPRFSSSFAARFCVSFYRRTSPQPSAHNTVLYSTVQYRAQFSSPFAVRRSPPSAVRRHPQHRCHDLDKRYRQGCPACKCGARVWGRPLPTAVCTGCMPLHLHSHSQLSSPTFLVARIALPWNICPLAEPGRTLRLRGLISPWANISPFPGLPAPGARRVGNCRSSLP